jgi:NAD(P)-dependent dehydrogenase (short-subunit alcohol dehydrogenase family)
MPSRAALITGCSSGIGHATAERLLAEGAVGILVNNAGYSQSGAIETVPIEQVRRRWPSSVAAPRWWPRRSPGR